MNSIKQNFCCTFKVFRNFSSFGFTQREESQHVPYIISYHISIYLYLYVKQGFMKVELVRWHHVMLLVSLQKFHHPLCPIKNSTTNDTQLDLFIYFISFSINPPRFLQLTPLLLVYDICQLLYDNDLFIVNPYFGIMSTNHNFSIFLFKYM